MIKCPKCQEEKEESEFYYSSSKKKFECFCKVCCRGYSQRYRNPEDPVLAAKRKEEIKERVKEWESKNREYRSEQQLMRRNANLEKAREHSREYYHRKKNSDPCFVEKRRLYAQSKKKDFNAARKKKRQEKLNDPVFVVATRISATIKRMAQGRKLQRSLSYIGLSSVEEFILEMGKKTTNQTWLFDKNMEIDHIWQLNWIDLDSGASQETLLTLFNNYSNLRPLFAKTNLSRSYYDFSPISREALEKFKDVLKPIILAGIEFYLGNPHLFSGHQINKASEEERIISAHLKTLGFAPTRYGSSR